MHMAPRKSVFQFGAKEGNPPKWDLALSLNFWGDVHANGHLGEGKIGKIGSKILVLVNQTPVAV